MRTVPVKTLAIAFFATGLAFALVTYAILTGTGDSSEWGRYAWIAGFGLIPIAYAAGGYLSDDWSSALWLTGAAFAAWVAADVVFLGIAGGCGQADECKPPSLIVAFVFPWVYLVLAALAGIGVLLRRQLRQGLIGFVALVAVVGLVWVSETADDEHNGQHSISPTPDGTDTGPAGVHGPDVARVALSAMGLPPETRVECVSTGVSGVGDWGCRVDSATVNPAYPVLVSVTETGAYRGSVTDSHGVTRSFEDCCLPVAAP